MKLLESYWEFQSMDMRISRCLRAHAPPTTTTTTAAAAAGTLVPFWTRELVATQKSSWFSFVLYVCCRHIKLSPRWPENLLMLLMDVETSCCLEKWAEQILTICDCCLACLQIIRRPTWRTLTLTVPVGFTGVQNTKHISNYSWHQGVIGAVVIPT